MADHKYIRKYKGKSGKMVYVYKDTSGHETTLNPEEEGADESGPLTSKQAQTTISDEERRKAKFAAFYQKAVATGKEIVEASQEESKKKSGGSGSSKKANTQKQSEGVSASSSGDPTVDAFAQKIMAKSILYEDIPPQYQNKVKTFVEFMKAMGVSIPNTTPTDSSDTPSSEQKQDVSASSSASATAVRSSSGSQSASAVSAEVKHAPNSIRPGLESTDEFERTEKSSAKSPQSSPSNTNNKTVTQTKSATTSNSTKNTNSSSGGVSGGGAGRSGHANTTVKMSDVKTDSPAIAKAVDWVKKLFGK